jgi:hypothetical protein
MIASESAEGNRADEHEQERPEQRGAGGTAHKLAQRAEPFIPRIPATKSNPIASALRTGSSRGNQRRRRWRRRSRLRCACCTAASAASPRSTASSAQTSSVASPGCAPTRRGSTRTSSSPLPPPVRPAAFLPLRAPRCLWCGLI